MRLSLFPNVSISGVRKCEIEAVQEAFNFIGIIAFSTPCHITITSTCVENYLGTFEPPDETCTDCFIYVKRRDYDKHNGSWLSTLVHELMHLKQYLEGRLTQAMLSAQGILDAALDSYLSLQHEVEAHRAEYAFRKDVLKEQMLSDNYFIKSYINIGHPLF